MGPSEGTGRKEICSYFAVLALRFHPSAKWIIVQDSYFGIYIFFSLLHSWHCVSNDEEKENYPGFSWNIINHVLFSLLLSDEMPPTKKLLVLSPHRQFNVIRRKKKEKYTMIYHIMSIFVPFQLFTFFLVLLDCSFP